MNWATALASGFGLGLLYFGDLLRTVRRFRKSSPGPLGAFLGRMARLGLTGVAFYGFLMTGGTSALLVGMAGVMLARRCFVRVIGRPDDGP